MNGIGYSQIRNLITTRLSTFHYGEQVIATDRKNRKKMFKLHVDGEFESRVGRLAHADIQGHCAGQSFKTNTGSPLTIKRPSLEEFVLFTRRRTNIMYPKDIWAAIGMMDIGPGSKVIEAGTGSGALTLYLSRTVGHCGSIISFDVKKDHHDNAIVNCSEWDKCLRYRGDKQLIDNIKFHNRDIKDAQVVVNDQVDAIALDLVDPSDVIGHISPLVRTNGVIVLYLPNISQVIQLSRHWRRACLPFFWESVKEIVHRQWAVLPKQLKRNTTAPLHHINNKEYESPHTNQPAGTAESGDAAITQVDDDDVYIARPSHRQEPHTVYSKGNIKLRRIFPQPHTAFLVKLRKT